MGQHSSCSVLQPEAKRTCVSSAALEAGLVGPRAGGRPVLLEPCSGFTVLARGRGRRAGRLARLMRCLVGQGPTRDQCGLLQVVGPAELVDAPAHVLQTPGEEPVVGLAQARPDACRHAHARQLVRSHRQLPHSKNHHKGVEGEGASARSAYIPEDEAPLELHIVAVVGAVILRRGGHIVSGCGSGLGHSLGVFHEVKGSKGL